MTDHIFAAKSALVDAIEDFEDNDRTIRIAQVHALIAIAESLRALTSGPDTPIAPRSVAPDQKSLVPGETEILAMPVPKGFDCPACGHGITVHRMHGCDAVRCKCTAPHGRLLPGDPQPGV